MAPPPGNKTMAVDAAPRSVRRYGVFTVADGHDAGRVLVIPFGKPSSFGREAECTFTFDDDSLSRSHATVVNAGPDYYLTDTSTNGTFINDVRVSKTTQLRDGDRVQLGQATFLRFAYIDEAEEAALRRVYEAAMLDGLTGVYNRKHLEERIIAELSYAARHGTPLSIIIIDVDHFKKVNDTHGHLAGDAVLKSVATLLGRTVRPEDIVARYGGEEFVIVARGTPARAAVALAERLREAVSAEAIQFEGKEIKVTSSAGVASLACCGETRDRATLLGAADRRLYAAKQGGRNRVIGPD